MVIVPATAAMAAIMNQNASNRLRMNRMHEEEDNKAKPEVFSNQKEKSESLTKPFKRYEDYSQDL